MGVAREQRKHALVLILRRFRQNQIINSLRAASTSEMVNRHYNVTLFHTAKATNLVS